VTRPRFTPPGLASLGLGLVVMAVGYPARAMPEPQPPLEERQESLTAQFRDLERSLLRLADLLSPSDPRRAGLLRRAFEQSNDLDIDARLANIVGLLKEGQLIKAGSAQGGAIENMRLLLELLESGDSDRRLSNTKDEVKRHLAKLAKLIARQRDIEGSTESGAAPRPLAERQAKLADDTRGLSEEIDGFAKRLDSRNPSPGNESPGNESPGKESQGKESEGKDSQGKDSQGKDSPPQGGDGKAGGKPGKEADAEGEQQADGGASSDSNDQPGDDGDDEASRARRTGKRLETARKRMKQAEERLQESQGKEARQRQEKAIEELEAARAELEEILRQVREEEVERLLVQLETRLRSMLRAEKAVLSGCEKLAASVDSAAGGETAGQLRERELEAARLSREQSAVAADAAKALVLVRDDGSAVAIPEALEQVRLDCLQSASRLGRGDVGGTTRGIVQDIVTSLEEMLAALEKAQRDQAQKREEGQGGGRPAQPGEQPLVDKLSELKMIRTLQMRINTRTKRFSQLLADGVEQADEPELVDAIQRLAERQVKVERAARDIASGRIE